MKLILFLFLTTLFWGVAAIFDKAKAATPEAQAKVIEDQADAAYYSGKIYATEFFVTNILPQVQGKATTVLGGNRSALAIQEAAF